MRETALSRCLLSVALLAGLSGCYDWQGMPDGCKCRRERRPEP